MSAIIISVIVPIYNGEKYISRAVESVLRQSMKQIELILVNDGSTDSSGMICDAYARSNAMVQVVHKQNGGLSSARNAGMAAARGAYIMFLDVDDYLDSETCEEVGKVIDEYGPDCIDFGWKQVSLTGKKTSNHHKLSKYALLGEEIIKRDILPPLLNLCSDKDSFIFDFVWNKVYRRDLIRSNNILFDEGRRVWEDRPFLVHYLKYCRNYFSIDRCFYNYVYVPNSLSQVYRAEFLRIIVANFEHYRKLFGDLFDFDVEYVNNHYCRAIDNTILLSLAQKENREQIREQILLTLQNQQVIHWFAKRTPKDKFEEELSILVASGQCEKALERYCKKVVANNRNQHIRNVKNKLKQIIRSMLRR